MGDDRRRRQLSERKEIVLLYIEGHLQLIELLAYWICASEFATKNLKQANRGGGDRHHVQCDLNIPIDKELLHRERNAEHSARAEKW